MTNYEVLAILALPLKGPGEAGELRLLVELTTVPQDGSGWRFAGTRLLAEQAGMTQRTVLATRDRLKKAGLIEAESAGPRGPRSRWRFLFPTDRPADVGQGYITPDVGQGYISGPDVGQGYISPDVGKGPNCGSPGVQHALAKAGSKSSAGAGAPARPDDDAQPDYRRGPGRVISGRVLRPGERPVSERTDDRPPPVSELCSRCGGHHNAARCDVGDGAPPRRSQSRGPSGGGPPAWAAPRSYPPPEVAAEGRARVDSAIAAARGEQTGTAPASAADRSEAARRALALRQVRESRAMRESSPHPSGPDISSSNGQGPLWAEDVDPDDPPF
jgi:hypothetical protein